MLILYCTDFNRKFFAYDELKTPAIALIHKSGLTMSMPLLVLLLLPLSSHKRIYYVNKYDIFKHLHLLA